MEYHARLLKVTAIGATRSKYHRRAGKQSHLQMTLFAGTIAFGAQADPRL